MSGQWEVVGKKKDKGAKSIPAKSSKDAGRKNNNLNVKIEDVLPKSQLKNLYGNDKSNNKKPQEKNKGPDGKGKPQKKTEKPQEVVKPKPPKSIESALNSIDVDEFKNLYEKTKNQFSDAPIVWLKQLVQYLNQKVYLDVADPVFMSKPATYPLNTVPGPILAILEKSVNEAGRSNVKLFFDISLTSLATDMSKNLPALGYKLFLQFIADNDPNMLAADNLSKHVVLRNSYQNRPNIGLSILWAIGQCGYKDFHIGLRIFQELMLPVIELKNYSRFVVKYLLNLVNSANVPITKDQYFFIVEIIHSNKKHFPADLKQDLIKSLSILKSLMFNNIVKENNSEINGQDLFIKKLCINNEKSYQDCLCNVLVESFAWNKANLQCWSKMYNENVESSAILLKYIYKHWDNMPTKFNKKIFSEILEGFCSKNELLVGRKKKENGLLDAVATIKGIQEKMATKKESGSSFKMLFIVLSVVIGGIVYYDVQKNGNWMNSKMNKMMKEYGVCDYTHRGLNSIDGRIEQYLPGYKKTVTDYSEDYIKLAKDLSLVSYNIFQNAKSAVVEKYPVFLQTIDFYAPGLVENSQNVVNNAWSTSVLYFNRSVDYLKNEVFVGHLSPENVQRIFVEALNTTQIKATEYYHWLYEKVQTTIK